MGRAVFVTDIEAHVRDETTIHIVHPPSLPVAEIMAGAAQPYKPEIETVPAMLFTNAYGERIYIGWSKRVQEILGLPFHALDTFRRRLKDSEADNVWLQAEIDDCKREIQALQAERAACERKLSALRQASIWQRLRYIITGNVPTPKGIPRNDRS